MDNTTRRAALIPYLISPNGQLVMGFMVPSDSDFGGTAVQLAKGGIDPGETDLQAAMREGEEELGVSSAHYASAPHLVATSVGNTPLVVYAVNILSGINLNEPHFETGRVVFLTAGEFYTIGRDWQRHAVSEIANKLETRHHTPNPLSFCK
jgi:8-oxo-dGTP pyrophosphatase MutT (NUDIX family)